MLTADVGDNWVQLRNLKYWRFAQIYRAISLYDKEEARATGASQKCDINNYDSLFKCKPVWTAAMLGFQSMRNPGRNISMDESMNKFKVRIEVVE
ncbi:MAG: hypothetical protein GY821_07920 [Gammaproteobacteria bacterium]|nr:hypothetical protein [Gammaproteobacteria bacterium]